MRRGNQAAIHLLAGLFLSLTGRFGAHAQGFESEIAAFEAAVARQPPPPGLIAFVGSSTFTRWSNLESDFPGFQVVNRGFGGSQFPDVLEYYPRLLPPLRPSLLLVYEGDNDLAAGRSVGQVFADWTNLLTRVASDLPETHVWFVAVKPSPSRVAQLAAQSELNRRVAADCRARAHCRFIDVATPMLDTTGRPRADLFVEDRLHLNASGYALWRSILAPELEAWARAHPEQPVRTPLGTVLIDLGSADSPTLAGSSSTNAVWNNLTASPGASAGGSLSTLVSVDGRRTPLGLVLLSRFNGANQNGTTAAGAPFPTSATRDSLFGNTESFGGLANLLPAFRLTGLDPARPVDLTFYASRTGVGDRRETRYTVTGASVTEAFLDAANNVTNVARAEDILPRADGSLDIALSPGPRNNNANHFTYLGVLRLAEGGASGRVVLIDFGAAEFPSSAAPPEALAHWNNLTPPDAVTAGSQLSSLLEVSGEPTPVTLTVARPFDRAVPSGIASAAGLPLSAIQDALAAVLPPGTNAGPEFLVSGLDPSHVIAVGVLASRTDASPLDVSRIFAAGSTSASVAFDPALAPAREHWIPAVRVSEFGTLRIGLRRGTRSSISPATLGLGTLRLEWRVADPPPPPRLTLITHREGTLHLRLDTAYGRRCQLESSVDLVTWIANAISSPPEDGILIAVPASGRAQFHRLLDLP